MRFVDEYRDRHAASRFAAWIARAVTRDWTIMEVCGGQTHTIVRFGIDQLLPDRVSLLHGPGCPVCVTPAEAIDKAIEIASRDDVTFCSFGDMVRVPGTASDLLSVRARGGDVRVVYSPLDAVDLARANPDREVVFFAVGFETTAPANALAVHRASQEGLSNFSMLVTHVLVPAALEAILSAPDNTVDAFLAAGHVCTVMGMEQYEPIARRHRVPIVVTGFEPLDILQGVAMGVRQLERGEARVENQYARAVRHHGNAHARALVEQVFEVTTRWWRGVGEIADSGLRLRDAYAEFDAEQRFGHVHPPAAATSECMAGLVLRGVRRPDECPAFGTRCTPEHPLGAPMVSSEGACAAYYRYRRSPERAS
ncbi:MAG: hydrogenase formation protein HypD [Betaproteobacteria bacterium]|nr:hydrogenase formation protein HypD [Betaproteobacteria bacterium]